MAEKDPQLEIKKRARRRLVGATALALIAAVVLPMVMDAEPRPLTEDIQIRIPNPEATAALSRPMPMKAAPKNGKADKVEQSAEPLPEQVPIEADGGSVKPATEPAKPVKPEKAEKPGSAKAETIPPAKAEKLPQSEAKPVELDKPEKTEKPEKTDKPAAPEKADKTAKADKPEKAEKSGEQFVVQLGTFSDSDNARRVRTKAKGLGFDTWSEPLKTADGEKLRVRAGPFPNRAAADAARAKLAEAGLTGVVTVKP